MAETVKLLLSGPHGGMVPHQRRKDPQLQPPQQKILLSIAAKPAQIRSRVQKSAHIQPRKHLQIHQDVGPPGAVIPCPHAAIPVHAHIRSP